MDCCSLSFDVWGKIFNQTCPKIAYDVDPQRIRPNSKKMDLNSSSILFKQLPNSLVCILAIYGVFKRPIYAYINLDWEAYFNASALGWDDVINCVFRIHAAALSSQVSPLSLVNFAC